MATFKLIFTGQLVNVDVLAPYRMSREGYLLWFTYLGIKYRYFDNIEIFGNIPKRRILNFPASEEDYELESLLRERDYWKYARTGYFREQLVQEFFDPQTPTELPLERFDHDNFTFINSSTQQVTIDVLELPPSVILENNEAYSNFGAGYLQVKRLKLNVTPGDTYLTRDTKLGSLYHHIKDEQIRDQMLYRGQFRLFASDEELFDDISVGGTPEICNNLYDQLMKESIFNQMSQEEASLYKIMVTRCCNKLEDIEIDIFPIILNSEGDIPCSEDTWAGEVLYEYREFWKTNSIVTNSSLIAVQELYEFLNSFYWRIYRLKLELQRQTCEQRVGHLYQFLSASFLSVLTPESKLEAILSLLFNRSRNGHDIHVISWKYDPNHILAKRLFVDPGPDTPGNWWIKGEIDPFAESEERLLIKLFKSFKNEEADFILNELITIHQGNKTLYQWLFELVSDGRERTRKNTDNSVEEYYWFETTEVLSEGGDAKALLNKARLTKEMFRLWRHSSYSMYEETNSSETLSFLSGINLNSYWFKDDIEQQDFNGKNINLNMHLLMSWEVREELTNIGYGQLPDEANYFVHLSKDRYEAEIDMIDGEYIRINKVNTEWGEYVGLETPSWSSSPEDLGKFHIFQPLVLMSYNPFPEHRIRIHQGKSVPAFLLHYHEAYDEYLDHQAYEDLVTQLVIEATLFYFTGGFSILRSLRFITQVRNFNRIRLAAGTAEFAANEIIANITFKRIGLRVFNLPASAAYSFSNYIAAVTDDDLTREIANSMSKLFFWTLMGSLAGDLVAGGIIKIINSQVDDIYDFTRYANSPTPDEIIKVNNKLGYTGQTSVVPEVANAIGEIPSEIITLVNQWKSTFDDATYGLMDVLNSLDDFLPSGTPNNFPGIVGPWLYARKLRWAEDFGHLDPNVPNDLSVWSRLNENNAELVQYWNQIVNHEKYVIDIDWLIEYKRFIDKPHEVTHITDIHYVTPNQPLANWSVKAGHGGKNQQSGELLNPETPNLPASMESTLVNDGSLIGVGHKTWLNVWFKLPNGSVPPNVQGTNSPNLNRYQFYDGNWYVKKHKHTIWDINWNDQRIREELANMWRNKKFDAGPVPDGLPINGRQPELTIYKSQLSDGTPVTIKHYTIGRQFGIIHNDLIGIITLDLPQI